MRVCAYIGMCYYYIILLYTVHVYAESVCAFVRGDLCAYVCVRTCMRTYMRVCAGAYTYVFSGAFAYASARV